MTGAPLTRRALLQHAAATAALVGVSGSIVSCGEGPEGSGSLQAAREAGYLRLGIANERPYGYVTAEGTLTGLGPTLAGSIAQGLGIPRVEGVVTEFDRLLRGLRAGAFDVVAAGMYIAADRCRQAAFGEPFYCSAGALAVRRGNPLGLRDLEDVAARRGARVAVLAGSVEGDDARAAGVAAGRVLVLPDVDALRDALLSGTADAVALTSPSVQDLVAANAGRLEATPPFTAGDTARCGAFAFRPENERLRRGFNRGLRGLQDSGGDVRVGRRFGFSAQEMTAAREWRAETICRRS